MVERVRAALEAAFPGIDVSDVHEAAGGRILGKLFWTGFAEIDDVERQQRIWAVLDKEIGSDTELVGVLLAYTPHEREMMLAA